MNARYLGYVLGLCLAAGADAAPPTFNNIEAPGNLESKNDIGCVGAPKLNNTYTPADLYRGLTKCIEAANYRDGVLMFALAGAYGRFDTFRVTDGTAHQAVMALQMKYIGAQPEDKQAAFKQNLVKTLGNPEGMAATCKQIAQIGAPNYYPSYMIQHGMGAFTKSGADSTLAAGFDAREAWKKARDTYLHCPDL